MSFINVKFLCGVAGIVLAMMSSCSGRGEYNAQYAPMDSVPFNVETNIAANSYIVHTYPNMVMFRVEYPQYKVRVKYGIVHSADSAKLMKSYTGQLNRMGDRVYYDDFSIDTISGDRVKGWIFTSVPDKTPLQMIVTDSMSMMLHGKLEFMEPQADTAGVILPAINAVKSDMRHMIDNLNLAK